MPVVMEYSLTVLGTGMLVILKCPWLMGKAPIQTHWALFMKVLGNLICSMATESKDGSTLEVFLKVNSWMVLEMVMEFGSIITKNTKENGKTI